MLISFFYNIILPTVDGVPPVCSAFDDVVVQIPFGSFGTQVTFTGPTATDNAGPVTLVSTSHQSGDFFQTGDTTVTYVYADTNGNTVDCTFIVLVVEGKCIDCLVPMKGLSMHVTQCTA